MKKSTVFKPVHAFMELFYPKICIACAQHLGAQEHVFCTVCILRFPYTNFHHYDTNPLSKKFWGRIHIHAIDSLLFLEKGSRTEKLLYNLKYQNRPEIGERLAELIIERYRKENIQERYDAIIPVPLHALKLKKRGYNQCSSFAKKLSIAWESPLQENLLVRTQNNDSQTGKSRVNRLDNVENIFEFRPIIDMNNKSILLIDDVLTTGATLEACALAIQKNTNIQLSILTMACKV